MYLYRNVCLFGRMFVRSLFHWYVRIFVFLQVSISSRCRRTSVTVASLLLSPSRRHVL